MSSGSVGREDAFIMMNVKGLSKEGEDKTEEHDTHFGIE